MLESLISVAIAFLVVTVSPGPANIAVATVAMSSGRAKALLFGFGLSVGLGFWGLVAATGLGAILQTSVTVLTALKVAGGLYLLWLALQSARSAARGARVSEIKMRPGNWFLRGLVLNLSNPKAVVAWTAALSMGHGSGDTAGPLIVATMLCVVIGFVNYTGYALAFSVAGFMTGYRRLRRWIDGAVASLFAAAGFALLRSAFSAR